MRSIANYAVKILLLSVLLSGAPAFGQESRIKLDTLDRLTAAANEIIDINVDGALLKLVPLAAFGLKPTSRARIKELIDGLNGIYIKRFEFEKEGDYTAEDVNAIRSQLTAPGWTRVAGVKTGRGRQHIEAYIATEGNNITGVAIISAEPRELIVANVVGVIDIDKLAELFREIDLPWLEWNQPGKREKE